VRAEWFMMAVVIAHTLLVTSSDANAEEWRPDFGCHIYRELDESTTAAAAIARAQLKTAAAARERHRWASAERIRGGGAVVPYPVVAFTFDDGPDYETTPKVLDALDKYAVPATFFVVGWRFAKEHPKRQLNAAMLDEVIRRGHTIGNHTFNHRRLPTLSRRRINSEPDRTESAIVKHLGYRPYLFRAPYGRMSRRVRKALASRAYTEVRWSIDPRDFREQESSVIASQVIDAVFEKGGGVVLLHDTKAWTAEATPIMFELLEQRNCLRIATSELPVLPASLDFFVREKDGSARSSKQELAMMLLPQLTRLRKTCKLGGKTMVKLLKRLGFSFRPVLLTVD